MKKFIVFVTLLTACNFASAQVPPMASGYYLYILQIRQNAGWFASHAACTRAALDLGHSAGTYKCLSVN